MKHLPFVSRPQEEISRIGEAGLGYLYLVKRQGITPNENPVDFQEQQKKQQKFLLKLNQRIKQLAKEQKVPVKEMRRRVMGEDAPKVKPGGQAKVEVVDDEDENQLFDYLDESTAGLLFDLQEDKANLAIRAATYMLRYRVVYPVHLSEDVKQGATSLPIEPVQQPIEAHTSIRFSPGLYAEVSETLLSVGGIGEPLLIDSLPGSLEEGAVGFLCEKGSRNLLMGYPEWEEEDTRKFLSERMIARLFEFYQKEAGVILENGEANAEPGAAEDLGNSTKHLSGQSQPPLSIGENSTTDSNGSVYETPDSTGKSLETSLAG